MTRFLYNDGALRDYHTHTTYSDGKNTPEEMIEAAIGMGLREIGISDHAYAECDQKCCIPKARMDDYFKELQGLKAKYADRISVLVGLEIDYFSDPMVYDYDYDYSIGAVHFIEPDGGNIRIDIAEPNQSRWVKEYFDGDYIAAAEKYFALVGEIVEKTDCDIIAHFDQFTKFNEGGVLFDVHDPRYVAAWKAAVDRLIPAGRVFEINTGAMSRGYRTTPYPSAEIMSYMRDRGAKFILSSDSHRTNWICWAFDSLGDDYRM